MDVTPEGVALMIACAGNIGAYVVVAKRGAYNTGATNARLSAMERTLTNGLSSEVKRHGEELVGIRTHCRDQHPGAEVS
jgi:hypothetical protein